MKILIIDNGTKHLGKLKGLLANHKLKVIPLFRKYTNTNDYDLIILSGGSQYSIASAPEVFTEEIKLIRESNVPIIGICEGCEMIAYAFGSKLIQAKSAKGPKLIEPIGENNILEGMENIKVYEAHRWSIFKLGKNLIGLARSKTGCEIIKHKKKKIYGLQFHPEMFADKTLGDEIFVRLYSKIMGEVKLNIE